MESILDIDLSIENFFLFTLAGLLTGIINTLAGSGSLITLPIFVFMCGLPADIANGTNRIGVFFQSTFGYSSFHRSGYTRLGGFEWLVIPGAVGAILGSYVAVDLDAEMMNRVIGFLMIFMLGVLMLNPKRWLKDSSESRAYNKKPLTLLIFFGIGVYAGFIQAGAGIFLMAALVLAARYSLTESAGLKLIFIFLINIPALIMFYLHGDIHFGYGLLMAVWQSLGALIGVRIVKKLPNANIWIHRLLVLIVVVSALKFFGILDWLF